MRAFNFKKSMTKIMPVMISVLFLGFGGVKAQAQTFEEGTAMFDSFLANASVPHDNIDSRPHKIICLGNSITLHYPLDKVNWYSQHGMAASKPENDYCHVLERLMRRHNPNTTVTPFNFSDWERNFDLNVDSVLRDNIKDKDIIVIRIGENVRDVARFSDALSKVIEYCKKYTPNIILTSMYWSHKEKELAIMTNARKYNLRYAPINWIWNLFQKECSPKEGDILYDKNNKPYPIVGEFILTHPNDEGMYLIAKSIYSVMGE